MARAVGLGDLPALLAGVVFGFSPRLLGTVAVQTGESLPGAVMPWLVLVVLLHLRGRLSPLRTAVLSGAAVVCMGGVNAVETAACLPLAMILVVWGVTRGLTSARFAGVWFAAVAAGCLWWALPLLVLSRLRAAVLRVRRERSRHDRARRLVRGRARGLLVDRLPGVGGPAVVARGVPSRDRPGPGRRGGRCRRDRPGRPGAARQRDQAAAHAHRRGRPRMPDRRARRAGRGAGSRPGPRSARRRAPDLPQRAQDRPGGPAAGRDRVRLRGRPGHAAAPRARTADPGCGAAGPARAAAGGARPRAALPSGRRPNAGVGPDPAVLAAGAQLPGRVRPGWCRRGSDAGRPGVAVRAARVGVDARRAAGDPR